MGSVRRAPRTGHWEARYRDPIGRQRTATFPRKADAQAFLGEVERAVRRGDWIDRAHGQEHLEDFVARVFEPTLSGLAPTSRVRDLSYLRTHILPAFGRVPIGTIDYSACQEWVNLLARRRAPATVVKAAQVLNKVFKTAVRARVIGYNPMTYVVLPRIEQGEDVFLTPKQIEALAHAMEQVAPRLRALIWVGCYAGPRIGELAALRWGDVDLSNRTISIVRKVVEVSGEGMVEGMTKTKAGRRTVTIPRGVAGELELHRERFPSDPLVFTSSQGAQVRPNLFRRREWAKAVRLAGLDPAPTPHDMRHTAVSLWIATGASDLEVARYAGHRSTSFTKDRYGHLFKDAGGVLADRLDIFIKSATDQPVTTMEEIRAADEIRKTASDRDADGSDAEEPN